MGFSNNPFTPGDYQQAWRRTRRIVSPYRKALLDEMTRLQRKGGGDIWNSSPSVYRKWLKLYRYQSWAM